MSLINDALKRARHQALEQDADGSSVSYRAVPAHSRRSGRPWVPYLVGGGPVALVMVVFLLVGRDSETAVEVPPAAKAAKAVAGASEDPGQGDEEAVSLEASSPSPTISESVAGPSIDQPSAQTEPASSASATPQSADSLAEEQPEQVEPPEARIASNERFSTEQEPGARLEAGKTYLRRVVAMDGGDVVLGGIAYSESRPIAVINGSVVTPGDMISGFTVIAITPEHVELEADGARIYLALH